jgi:hypothetical protein
MTNMSVGKFKIKFSNNFILGIGFNKKPLNLKFEQQLHQN